MEFIFRMEINIKFLQAGSIIFDGSGKAFPKCPIQQGGNVFAINEEKSIATVFVFYCDTKHLDIVHGSSNVVTYIIFV